MLRYDEEWAVVEKHDRKTQGYDIMRINRDLSGEESPKPNQVFDFKQTTCRKHANAHTC